MVQATQVAQLPVGQLKTRATGVHGFSTVLSEHFNGGGERCLGEVSTSSITACQRYCHLQFVLGKTKA